MHYSNQSFLQPTRAAWGQKPSNRLLRAIKTPPFNLFWALVGPQLASISKVQNSTAVLQGGLSRLIDSWTRLTGVVVVVGPCKCEQQESEGELTFATTS